jgi:hypothetical protein
MVKRPPSKLARYEYSGASYSKSKIIVFYGDFTRCKGTSRNETLVQFNVGQKAYESTSVFSHLLPRMGV